MVFTVTSIVTLTPSKVMAASYPSVFFFSDEDYENLVVTMTMAKGVNTIRMLWYPEYNNEGYDLGEYTLEVKKLFYSLYRWNEAPTASHLYITLVETISDSESNNNSGSDCVWREENGKSYWYEGGIKQGTYNDPKGVIGDGTVRGREIYDSASDGWYWLDACYDGAKATSKEVWMPYIYQNEADWSDTEIWNNANASDSGMAQQVHDAIVNKQGKWVRYDSNGKMYKGWYTVEGVDADLYPSQAGNTYYYDNKTGLMAKGYLTIDGVQYHFDENTGALIR